MTIKRCSFIGGSDAQIIMGDDEAALLRLWKEKRGDIEPEDLSGDLLVQLGTLTEELNRHWYEKNTGQVVTEVQRQVFHPIHRWMAATLDGRVEALVLTMPARMAAVPLPDPATTAFPFGGHQIDAALTDK